MARMTKAQLASRAEAHLEHAALCAAAEANPWPWPKSPAIDAQQQACQAARDQAKAAAMAFFQSRMAQQKPADDQDLISDADIAAQQAAAEKAFDEAIEAAMAASHAAAAKSGKRPYIPRSSILRPTKAAHALYSAMHAAAQDAGLPAPTRGECIAEAIARGIASGTAATQYQYWKNAGGI